MRRTSIWPSLTMAAALLACAAPAANAADARSTAACAIAGEVAQPGQFTLSQPSVDIQDLIHAAGGFAGNATGAIQVIRDGRAGQHLFYSPQLRFDVRPGDLILAQGSRRSSSVMLIAGRERELADDTVQLALVGLGGAPVVVKMRAIDATIPQIARKLRQPAQIIPTIQVLEAGSGRISLARGDNFEPLPNGSVLIFDPRYVLREALPNFPPAKSLDRILETTSQDAHGPLPAPVDLPEKIAEDPSSQLTQSMPDEATRTAHNGPFAPALPMTLSGDRPDHPLRLAQTPSRFERSTEPDPSLAEATDQDVGDQPGAMRNQEIASDDRAARDAAASGDNTKAAGRKSESNVENNADDDSKAGISPWQILGVAGAMALLMVLAVASRPRQPTAARSSTAPAPVTAPKEVAAGEAAQLQRWDRYLSRSPAADSETAKPITPRATESAPDDASLLDLLIHQRLSIVEEPPQFAHDLEFFGQPAGPEPPQADSHYRVDAAHAQAGQSGPHLPAAQLGAADSGGAKTFVRHGTAGESAAQPGRPRRPKFLNKAPAAAPAPVAAKAAAAKRAPSGGLLDRTLLNLRERS